MSESTKMHYIAMSGEHGCMPDNLGVYDFYANAVESLASLFELGRRRHAELKRDGYLELNPTRDGASYCEITEEPCQGEGCEYCEEE